MNQPLASPPSPRSPWLRRWPGSQRSLAGLERVLWRRLPFILLVGVLIPLVIALAARLMSSVKVDAETHRDLTQWVFMIRGLVMLHLSLLLTLVIGCAIVILMKGPAYMADPYFLDGTQDPCSSAQPKTPIKTL